MLTYQSIFIIVIKKKLWYNVHIQSRKGKFMAKDAFNRNGSTNNQTKAEPKEKEKDTNEPSNTTSNNSDKKGKNRFKKAKDVSVKKAKTFGKNKAKEKLRNSDGAAGASYQAYEKVKKTAKKTKKYMGWFVKYVQFCISNPIGWILGIFTVFVIVNVADDIAKSLKPNETSDGEKATVVLMDCPPEKGGNSSDGKTHSDGANNADWTQEGTKAYKNAKYVFDTWIDAGLSGEAAAGIVGWVASEGGFDIVGRAEGHVGGGEKDSIANGAVPKAVGVGYSKAGGGIYQFTPYDKYAPLNDPKWEDPVAITKFAMTEIVSPGGWNPTPHDLTGGNHSLEQFAQETDPTKATLMFNSYEKGDPKFIDKSKKQEAAKRANEVFNKDGHKFDREKFEKNFGSGRSGNSSSTNSSSTSKKKCKPRSGGGNGWQGKGGKHNYSNGQGWKPSDLPADLKQYALDPTSLGMKYESSDGWDPIQPHGFMYNQCTGLSSTLMYWLWEKDGKHPTQLEGNGIDVVSKWVQHFGGSSTKEPVSGAVFSSRSFSSAGHTGVVSHVFDDGSILIVEQNCKNLSGEATGQRFTWDYRIITKDTLESDAYEFYNPGDNGFTVNPNAKSM